MQNGAGWTNLTDLGGDVQSITTSQSPNPGTVFAVNVSDNVVEDRYTFGGGDSNIHGYWTGFADLGSGFKAVTAAGTQVYGLGPDNHVYAINPGSGKTDVGGYTPTMALGGNEVNVALGSDHSVYVNEQNADGSWTGAIDLGGYLKSVTAEKTRNGAPVVFGIDYNDDVWVDEQTPNGTWSGWNELPTQILAANAVGAIAPDGAAGGCRLRHLRRRLRHFTEPERELERVVHHGRRRQVVRRGAGPQRRGGHRGRRDGQCRLGRRAEGGRHLERVHQPGRILPVGLRGAGP